MGDWQKLSTDASPGDNGTAPCQNAVLTSAPHSISQASPGDNSTAACQMAVLDPSAAQHQACGAPPTAGQLQSWHCTAGPAIKGQLQLLAGSHHA